MSEAHKSPNAPAEWLDSLNQSKADIAEGRTVPLLPVLDRLRAAAERLEAELGIFPDETGTTLSR